MLGDSVAGGGAIGSQISVFVVSSAGRLPKLARSIDRQRNYKVVGAALSSMVGSAAIVDNVSSLDLLRKSNKVVQ
ncbi:MAG: hypothetical protein NT070_01715 [Cyanobacteria bacterium]|nr:hypothetical protein [Cyanobacteriota bacterium]